MNTGDLRLMTLFLIVVGLLLRFFGRRSVGPGGLVPVLILVAAAVLWRVVFMN